MAPVPPKNSAMTRLGRLLWEWIAALWGIWVVLAILGAIALGALLLKPQEVPVGCQDVGGRFDEQVVCDR